jgi:hypothetical protein
VLVNQYYEVAEIFSTVFKMLLVHSAIAQDFAPIGAEWYYTERHAFSGDITFLKISSIKDTIVNQKNCRILLNEASGFKNWQEKLKSILNL